jgi:membrane protease YdiL (CAAX protease family)
VFTGIRQVRWTVLVLFVVMAAALTTAAVASFRWGLLDWVVFGTRGLINETLAANLILLALLVGGVIFFIGRLRPSDLGLVKSGLAPAAGLVLLVWLAAQAAQALSLWSTGGEVALNPLWERRGVSVVLGLLFAQLLGNALYEEIAYRGFLLPQIHLLLGRWLARPAVRLAAALGVSQSLFALAHVPNRLYQGVALPDLLPSLLSVLAFGLLYSFIYIRTGNLFFAVGVHAFSNTPTFVVGGNEPVLVLALGFVVALLWPYLRRGPAAYGAPSARPVRS